LSTPLIQSSEPLRVVQWLRENFDIRSLYAADLDAIAGRSANRPAIESMLRAEVDIWLDPGVADADQAASWSQLAVDAKDLDQIIVGLESVRRMASLPAIVQAIGETRAVFSLDLCGGRTRVADPQWAEADPTQIVEAAIRAGFRKLIVLDLAGVGASSGIAGLSLCRAIRRAHPAIELITGGGVRDANDLRLLADAGCDATLIATALYYGTVTRQDIQSLA
jgi:phosphoribosylformimino-5-aminoimidazole carboxamide ribotide isomerase